MGLARSQAKEKANEYVYCQSVLRQSTYFLEFLTTFNGKLGFTFRNPRTYVKLPKMKDSIGSVVIFACYDYAQSCFSHPGLYFQIYARFTHIYDMPMHL